MGWALLLLLFPSQSLCLCGDFVPSPAHRALPEQVGRWLPEEFDTRFLTFHCGLGTLRGERTDSDEGETGTLWA